MSISFRHHLPVYVTVISALLSGFAGWNIRGRIGPDKNEANIPVVTTPNPAACKPVPARILGYNYIAPLLLAESQCESPELDVIKNSLTSFIDQQKATGILKEASFYFRDIEKTAWTGYREDEKYFPGSLMKVPDAMSLFAREEQHPGILNTKLYYASPFIVEKNPVFISKKLETGKYYTVQELMRYAIAYSDNNATMLLANNFDDKNFDKLLADFRLPPVDNTQKNYPISARDFSKFMRSIYNSSYLSKANSELTAELLSQCDFKDGFEKGLPAGIKLIHKFGEAGGINEKQLHESAIIYISGHPYLLTVMTKGNDLHKLTGVLSGMAAIVYGAFSGA